MGLSIPGAAHAAKPAAPPERINSVNINPIGFLLGSYTVNYNRLLSGGHSVLGEAAFSTSSDDNTSSTSGGLQAGYRWYWGGKFDSGFVGANVGYSIGTAETNIDDTSFGLSVRALTATVNVGKRWAWDGGFNLTVRIGAGRAAYTIESSSNDPDVQEAIDQTEKLFNALPIALDGELSAGYCF